MLRWNLLYKTTISDENSFFRDLQNENRQLRMLLQDHQSALELVMMKYREQVGSLVRLSTIEQMLAKQLEADEKVCYSTELKKRKVSPEDRES